MGVRAGFGALAPDEQKYLELCEQGAIYEYLMGRLRAEGIVVTRDQIKEQFYTLYYDKVRTIRKMRDPLARAFATAFATEFPGVLEVVRAVKNRAGYRHLSCWMQNIESSIVIGTVCERLRIEYPHVPVLTIHDSIATTPPYVELVQRLMVEEFERIGLRPIIKSEHWSAPRERQLSA